MVGSRYGIGKYGPLGVAEGPAELVLEAVETTAELVLKADEDTAKLVLEIVDVIAALVLEITEMNVELVLETPASDVVDERTVEEETKSVDEDERLEDESGCEGAAPIVKRMEE